MKIDDAVAMRLYLHSRTEGIAVTNKESIANADAHLQILDVPCDVSFGFSSRKILGSIETNACAWIFSSSGNDFFGAFYLPVDEDSNAPATLNSTIAQAIEQAKVNHKLRQRKDQSLN